MMKAKKKRELGKPPAHPLIRTKERAATPEASPAKKRKQ